MKNSIRLLSTELRLLEKIRLIVRDEIYMEDFSGVMESLWRNMMEKPRGEGLKSI